MRVVLDADKRQLPKHLLHHQINQRQITHLSYLMSSKIRQTLKPPGKIAKLSTDNFADLEYLATLKGIEYIEHAREKKGGVPLPWGPDHSAP